jgi:hypothetical protein
MVWRGGRVVECTALESANGAADLTELVFAPELHREHDLVQIEFVVGEDARDIVERGSRTRRASEDEEDS